LPRLDWIRRVAVAVLIAATLSSALLGVRSYRSFLLLRSAHDAGAPMTSSVRPWMTLDYIAATYRVPETALVERLALAPGTDPLTAFLALTVLGRLLWTSAYLGLGYAVGSDPEAATGFLANLSGLLVSLAVLAASWLIASGRVRMPQRPEAI